ncbi:hypothetical protein [Croceitalea sp. P059]|uniref:hypothetical protein n=1 Tax=Croceitalea sp. P059 TaxID=3075601 RepID=UPI002883F0DF|nr:hypothetical protein [Croceitalea sp. P059]MDT0539503.1 hypothetical protein [Croceitalea sp. P059]
MKKLVYVILLFYSVQIWSQADIVEVGNLPQQIIETSGLLSYNGKLITHNDSGNAPELYELDITTSQITRTVSVANVVNIDWEDLAQDENYIYIGDFGNNTGDRQDLNILKILKSDYDNSDSVTAEIINFLYEDQTDFTSSEDSDFDAEGFFSLGDNLIILTKQWQQNGTVAYKVPKLSGAFLAERLDSYQVNGLVTGATYNQNTNQLSIVGYSQFLFPFYVLVDDVQENAIFEGEKTKTNLNIGQAQVEAITLVGAEQFYISSEDFSNPPLVNSPSRLFTFSLDSEEEENPPGEENPEGENTPDEELVVYKTFGSQSLNYSLITNRAVTGMGVFDVTGRMVTYIPLERISTDPIDISSFNQSLYYLTFFLIDDAISVPFFRD